jgi:hypothetical protein
VNKLFYVCVSAAEFFVSSSRHFDRARVEPVQFFKNQSSGLVVCVCVVPLHLYIGANCFAVACTPVSIFCGFLCGSQAASGEYDGLTKPFLVPNQAKDIRLGH